MSLLRGLLLLGAVSIFAPARALDGAQLCLQAINAWNGLAYKVDEQSLRYTLNLVNGQTLQVESYFAHGRPSVVGLVKADSPNAAPLIAKVSRVPQRKGKNREERYRQALRDEYNFYQANAAKFRGRVVPILDISTTREGEVVITKPYLDPELNKSLGFLVANRQLTSPMLASLKEHLAWGENFPTQSDSKGIHLDLNPLNYVWVADASIMRSLGLKKPGFILYEITPRGATADTRWQQRFMKMIKAYDSPSEFTPADLEGVPNYSGPADGR